MSDDSLKRMLERLDDRLDRVDVTLERLTTSVEYHVKRTDLLEEKLEATDKKIEPALAHVAFMGAAAKIGSILGALLLGAKSLGLL